MGQMEHEDFNEGVATKTNTGNLGRSLLLSVILGVILHFLLFWIFEKVPVMIKIIESIKDVASEPAEIKVVEAPIRELTDLPDIQKNLVEPAQNMDFSKVEVELEDIKNEVDVSPEVLDNLMDIKFESPALNGSDLAESFKPIIAPKLDLDIPELGRNPELLTNPIQSQIHLDPGKTEADIFDPDKYTQKLIKKGANGLAKNGFLEGFTTLEKMADLKGNALTNAKAMIGSDLLFEFNSADLKSSARNSLLAVAFLIEQNPNKFCIVEGHTDLIGGEKANLKLSQQRAEAVKNWITSSLGLNGDKIIIRAFGKQKPIVLSGDKDAQAINRRVEIKIRKKIPVKNVVKANNQEGIQASDKTGIEGKNTPIIPKAIEVDDIPKAIAVPAPIDAPLIPRAVPVP